MSSEEPLMYSQFCYYIQRDEEKRRATMHIPRKPGEQGLSDPQNKKNLEKIKVLLRLKERQTGLEPATSTLARWRTTNCTTVAFVCCCMSQRRIL